MKILFKIYCGSKLYGLETKNSDVDIVGVYIEKYFDNFINPFKGKRDGEVNKSIISKNEDGTNNKDAIDEKYYHLSKFINLCSNMNPNILEMLFVSNESIIYVEPKFKELILDNYKMFLSTKYINTFKGYAMNCYLKSITDGGYKPKDMHHYIRLLEESKQLQEDGRINFPFTGVVRDMLMDIKTKLMTLNNVQNVIKIYENRKPTITYDFPSEPDKDKIKKTYSNLIKYYFKFE